MLEAKITELTRRILLNQYVPVPESERSPSPEPIYDHAGKRLNTREQRFKDKLLKEREELVKQAMKLNPLYKPPADYKPNAVKKMKKIMIPVDKHPGYNFIGLLLGPRGRTHRELEKDTGAKISIRGKGSVKEGKVRKDGRPDPDAHEPQHVVVVADTEDQLERAAKKVEALLVYRDDNDNEHKQKQLRELAAINGTLRDTDYVCHNCGEPGHRIYDCPNRQGKKWNVAGVRCALCGETSHPTSDCPQRVNGSAGDSLLNSDNSAAPPPPLPAASPYGPPPGSGPPPPPPAASNEQIDKTYEDFMKELGGGDDSKQEEVKQPPLPSSGSLAGAPIPAPNMYSAPPPGYYGGYESFPPPPPSYGGPPPPPGYGSYPPLPPPGPPGYGYPPTPGYPPPPPPPSSSNGDSGGAPWMHN
mmetsp:Transcript_26088/g.66236  ORF Transcript_26088/g.66236 Transcript_26088/m.66236 type:complete len:415 (+) Transcript_26088:237-1481(+)